MKLIKLQCDNCGSELILDPNAEKYTCSYCNTSFLLDKKTQYIQYVNAEETGYQFEKGRYRAQQEYQQDQAKNKFETYNSKKDEGKKKNLIWWILGWIVIFPVPLTVLLVRNKKIDKKLRIAIIAIAWLLYLGIGIFGKNSQIKSTDIENSTNYGSSELMSNSEADGNSDEVTDLVDKDDVEIIYTHKIVDNLINAGHSVEIFETFYPPEKDSRHYRVEFRLNAYKNSMGYALLIDDLYRMDVIEYKSLTDTRIRIYFELPDYEKVQVYFPTIINSLDQDLSQNEVEELISNSQINIDIRYTIRGENGSITGYIIQKRGDMHFIESGFDILLDTSY